MKSVIVFLTLVITTTYAASGQATFYGGNPFGNSCGANGPYTGHPINGHYAAAGSTIFDDGYGCGRCYRITCAGPSKISPLCVCAGGSPQIVQIIDQCAECSSIHFDLNRDTAVAVVGSLQAAAACGVVGITFERVQCDIPGGFIIRNKAGTSKWWYGFHMENVSGWGNVNSVHLFKGSKIVTICDKSQGPSNFYCPLITALPNPPLTVKLFGDFGTTTKATDCISNYNGGATFICSPNLQSKQ
mmetsp:Transcript_11300/g.12425  ORF Transcript_11300/g.12425 Transcript_11300/m.12425 type:complete len:244 (-) Transcript_11300:47-778(-)